MTRSACGAGGPERFFRGGEAAGGNRSRLTIFPEFEILSHLSEVSPDEESEKQLNSVSLIRYPKFSTQELAMSTVKDEMVNIITKQPEDSSYDEILRELAYARMVQRGLTDSDNGRTVSNDEVRQRIESWQK